MARLSLSTYVRVGVGIEWRQVEQGVEMKRLWIALAVMGWTGCASAPEDEECFSHEDCPPPEMCVIDHNHEGDDHSHGGTCVAPDTGE